MEQLQFLKNAKKKEFKTKSIIYKTNNNYIYYVFSGKVLLAIETLEKKHFRILNTKNNFFAIPEVYSNQGIKSNALAINDSVIYYWSKEEFEMGVSMYPEMALMSIINLCSLLRYINEQNEKLSDDEIDEISLNLNYAKINDEELEQTLFEVAFTEKNETLESSYKKLGVEYENGEVIFNQGDTSNDIYIILEGNVDIILTMDGEKLLLNTIGAESFLGEMSHFDFKPRSAGAVANGKVRMIKFTKDSFNIIFQLHPKWTIKLIQTLSDRIVNTYNENIG